MFHIAPRVPRHRAAFVGLVALVVCMSAFVGHAQQPGANSTQSFEIRGVVQEAGVSRTVPDVDVVLILWPADRPKILSPLVPKNVIQVAKTDNAGAFSFTVDKPGDYRVEIYKEPYKAAPDSNTGLEVTISDAKPKAELRFMLIRPGEISGRLIDDETDKPIAGLAVRALQRRYWWGRAMGWPGGVATTDAEGRFVIRGVQPADYILQPGSRMYSASAAKSNPEIVRYGVEEVFTTFSEHDLKATNWDYERLYWPGGAEIENTSPVQLTSGMTLNLGDIRLRRKQVYSALVTVRGGCTANDSANIKVVRFLAGSRGSFGVGTMACGKPFLVRGLAPGSYAIEALAGSGREARQRGTTSFEIVDKTAEVPVSIARGVDVEGKFLLADGVKAPDFSALNLRLTAVAWVNIVDETTNKIDAQGRFRIVNVQVRDQRLFVTGLQKPYYIKEARYNLHPISGDVLRMAEQRGVSHSLEIVIDDKPATLTGTVTESDRPVDQPHVVLVRWPIDLNDAFDLMRVSSVAGDKNGKFQVGALPPGEYRVFAIAAADRDRLNEPHVLEQMLGHAQKVVLSQSGYQDVKLELMSIR